MPKERCCAQCALFSEEDVKGYGFCEFHQYGVQCSDEACDYLLPKVEDNPDLIKPEE